MIEIERLKPKWLESTGDYVISFHISPQGQDIAVISGTGQLTILNSETGKVKNSFFAHKFGGLQVEYSPDGARLLTTGQDGFCRIWDAVTFELVATIRGGAAWVEQASWRPSSLSDSSLSWIALSSGRKVKIARADGTIARELPDHSSTVATLKWSADGTKLFTCCYGKFYGWDACNIQDEKPKQYYEWKGSLLSMAVSPDGQYVGCGTQEGSVHLWDLEREEDLEMSGYPLKVLELAWDESSRYLATGGGDEAILWDFSDKGPAGSKPVVLKAHLQRITDLAFQPKGLALASGAEDGAVLLWQPAKRKRAPLGLALRSEAVSKISWKRDGKSFIVGYADGILACWHTPASLGT